MAVWAFVHTPIVLKTWQSTPGLSVQLFCVLDGLGAIGEVACVELEDVVEGAVVGLQSRQ